MKHPLQRLAVVGILFLAIGIASGQNLTTAQSGPTRMFLPLVSLAPTPRPIVKLNPTVGTSTGGKSYEDWVADNARVAEMWLSSGGLIEGVQMWYLDPDGLMHTPGQHGGWGGGLHKIVFDADEYIVAVNGKSDLFMDSLSVVTNKRIIGPYGGSGGTPFSIIAPVGYEIVGFFGKAGGLLDSTGALARVRSTTPFPPPPPPARPVLRLTPTMGYNAGGISYQDTVPSDGRVSELWVLTKPNSIDALQFWFTRADGSVYTPGKRGFATVGVWQKLIFDADEYIVEFTGRSGEFMDQLSVITNKRAFGPWGGPGGDPFIVRAPTGYEICGLYGRYGMGLDMTGALGRQR